MELSLFLAKVIGLYLVLISLAVFLHRREINALLVEEFYKNRTFVFFSGAIILTLGLLVVVSHNVWELSWRGVITFLGWLTVLKGAIRIFVPNVAKQVSHSVDKGGWNSWYTAILVVSLLVGLWLVYTGFTT
jgi:hypothetical protein